MLYPLSYEGGDAGSLPCSQVSLGCAAETLHCMSATRKARNKIDRVTGQAKERIGEATGNARLRDEGVVDQLRAERSVHGRTGEGRAARPQAIAPGYRSSAITFENASACLSWTIR